ncbi:hypothetical protein BGZ95_011380 [Linnemannia exigua]|uniref:BTB domain-containing protein n=1 Tax=Linnemannia exigua TaxID=604196 RepID=A0AAD4DJV0_9FUNG|nr:hypothetical protein BGZ95_011380 [Linnemannia exigua]
MAVSTSAQRSFQGDFDGNNLFQANTSPLQFKHTTPPQQQQQYTLQQQQRHNIPSHPQQPTQVSTKALALTSTATRGTAPPPLMGSAIVLVNDSALHCFGGRLENRDLTNGHYVLDVETGFWDTLHDVSSENASADSETEAGVDPSTMLSLSLTTDPVEEVRSGTLSDPISVPPSPRYFHTLSAFGTSLILFGGMGKVYDSSGSDENTSDKQQQETSEDGTDTAKAYVEDACVLDLHTWEWVASIQSIGQCGSYRTIAATGPGKQSASSIAPASPSFPSATASSPQTSANLSWPSTDSGPIDAMASISMVLSGRISAPSSTTASSKGDDTPDRGGASTKTTADEPHTKRKNSERLMSGELTPAFRTGKDVPSIYLYSNYDFKNLQRDFKVITPHYTHPATAMDEPVSSSSSSTPTPPPSFSLVEKTQALAMMGHELPPGLRFPQGHVYQNRLILTGTLILPGKKPTLAIYAFNLTHYKWEQLSTDSLLETGSWSRSLLHPATGTLLIFGNQGSNADEDYANRLQHHNHIMMVNLQAYGMYERPIPSFSKDAQDLGLELLSKPSLSDMQVCSATGTLFGANSTVLAARWPEFSSMLLSPPYVTPLILILPVPDDVVPLFLQYLYTGGLPTTIPAGMADYLLILARRYELNGLYALTMDILHQSVHLNPIRIYSTALMAGELGLQARAIGLAVQTLPSASSEPRELPPVPTGVVRSNSMRAPPPPTSKVPYPPTHRRAASRDSISTDGGHVRDNLLQQYNGGQRLMPSMIQEDDEKQQQQQQQQQPLYLSSPNGSARQRPARAAAPLAPTTHQGAYQGQPTSPLGSPVYGQGGAQYQTAYPSPLSPSFQQHPFTSQPIYDDYQLDDRTLQAKKRLQMQMQYDMEQQVQQHQLAQQEYIQQQQYLLEQEHMRGQEMLMLEQHRLQHQRYLQKQQQLRGEVLPSAAVVSGALDYHFGGAKAPAPSKIRGNPDGSIVESVKSGSSGGSSGGGGGGGKKNEKEKEKKSLKSKMKPPKPTLSGADLMKSAGF